MVSPLKKDYNDTVMQALKADHQVYTCDKLEPFDFGNSSSLPGVLKVFTSPYYIVKNLYNVLSDKVKGVHATKVEAWVKIGTESGHLTNSIFTIVKYAMLFKLLLVASVVVTAVTLGLGIGISVVEIVLHSIRAIEDRSFQRLIKKTLINELHILNQTIKKEGVKKPEIKTEIEVLLKRVKDKRVTLEKQYSKEYVDKLEENLFKISQMCETSHKASIHSIKTKIQTLTMTFLEEFCKSNLKRIGKEFMELSDAEKVKLLKKSEQNFDEISTGKALQKSLEQVQEKFRKKKLFLAKRVEPWLAADFSNKYQLMIEGLESKNRNVRKEAIDLTTRFLSRLNHNSVVNENMNVLGISAFAATIAAYAISIFVPAVSALPLILLTVATLASTGTYLYKKGYAQSENYNFDFYNCVPKFLQKIHAKFATTPLRRTRRELFAENLTALIGKERHQLRES